MISRVGLEYRGGGRTWSLSSAHTQHASAASTGSTTGALSPLGIINSDHRTPAADATADAAQKCPIRNKLLPKTLQTESDKSNPK